MELIRSGEFQSMLALRLVSAAQLVWVAKKGWAPSEASAVPLTREMRKPEVVMSCRKRFCESRFNGLLLGVFCGRVGLPRAFAAVAGWRFDLAYSGRLPRAGRLVDLTGRELF